MLVVSRRSKITPADDAAIKQHRDELLVLVRYIEAYMTRTCRWGR